MDNLRTAIRRFLDYQLDSDTNADDSDAYTQLVAAYAIGVFISFFPYIR